jgi:hypothetical protein
LGKGNEVEKDGTKAKKLEHIIHYAQKHKGFE